MALMYTKEKELLIKSASYASVLVALIIMISKFYGWFQTESYSLFVSLVDSMLDISSSLINVIAIRISLRPPNDLYRFGHNKFQDLAIFSQSIFFFLSCIFTFYSSIKALFSGLRPANSAVGINIMYFCIGLTFLLVCYQSYVVKKTHSKIIIADKIHYFSDLLSNIVVIMSLYLSVKYWYLDALAGIGISIYILGASYGLFRGAMKNLADEELSQIEKNKIFEIIKEFKEVHGMHDLKTRYAGNKAFIQFHIEMDGNLLLYNAHDIAENVTQRVQEVFPGAEVIIHQDPVGIDEDVQYKEKL